MKTVVTLSSRGQLTLPVAVRKALRLEHGDGREISIDEEKATITSAPVAGTEARGARSSGYAAVLEPETDVDPYYRANCSAGPDE